MKLIDKDKAVAEIKKRYEHWREKEHNSHSIESEARMSECQHLMLLLNSIETKEMNLDREIKEEDLEKEIEIWWNNRYKELNDKYEFFGKYNGHYMENSTVISLVKYFFELGLKAKGE